MLIQAQTSSLLIVDVQQGLAPIMADPRRVFRGCSLLMRAAVRLGIPLVVSEQYPKGLGATMGELAELAPEGSVMEKIAFSCAADTAILDRFLHHAEIINITGRSYRLKDRACPKGK